MALWVKDLVLSLLYLWLLLWHGFAFWSENFCMRWAQPQKKKEKKIVYLGEVEWKVGKRNDEFTFRLPRGLTKVGEL